jgi:hypothetical protein
VGRVARPKRIGFVGLENVCVARGRRIVKRLFLLKFDPRDDDDEFLYGDSELKESSPSNVPAAVVDPVPSAGETPLLVLCPSDAFCILLVPTKYNRHFAHLLASLRACASVEPDE